MYVIRRQDGILQVPQSLNTEDGRLVGDAYVEVGPDDPEYERLLAESITEEELAGHRHRWREENDELERQFLAYKAEQEAEPDR
ncbi:hypothetical protein [Rhizohabitans arisaemae]|uniref:hypothetical protein n=1 Tax=Rhizohabitans arisaemae TaxID=2720610 RepID=UPI0024B240E9|nr:hypothetical protein [Rhizohabitans arisaemae]